MKKKLLTVLLAVVMVFGVFGLTACGGSNKDEDYNYYGVKYSIEDEVKIEAVTFQAVYKMFTTPGKFVLYVNSGESAADFQAVNKLANDWDVTIYHFNPDLTGGYAKDLSNAVNGNLCSDLTGIAAESQLKAVQDLLLSISKKDLAFWKEADGKILGISGADSTVSATGELQYKGSVAAANTIADGAKSIAAVSIKNPSYGSYTDDAKDVPYIPAAYNTDGVGTMNLFADARLHIYDDRDAITEEKTDVFVTVANYEMFAHLLDNNDGYFAVFFGGTWCPNTQAILYHVNYLAKDYGMNKVYFFDPRLDDGVRLDQVVASTEFDQNAYNKEVAAAESVATIAKNAAASTYKLAGSAAATAYNAAILSAEKAYDSAIIAAEAAYQKAAFAAQDAKAAAEKAANDAYAAADDAIEAAIADKTAAEAAKQAAQTKLDELNALANAATSLKAEIKAAQADVTAAANALTAATNAYNAAVTAKDALETKYNKELQYAADVRADALAAFNAAKAAYEQAKSDLKDAQDTYDAAEEAYEDLDDNADENEVKEVEDDYEAADKALDAAEDAFDDAAKARKPLYDAYVKADAAYKALEAEKTAALAAAARNIGTTEDEVKDDLASLKKAAEDAKTAAEGVVSDLTDYMGNIASAVEALIPAKGETLASSNVAWDSIDDLVYLTNRVVADYEEELAAKEKALEEAEEALEEAEEAFEEAKEAVSDAVKDVEKAEKEFAKVEKELKELRDELEELIAEKAEINAEIAAINAELEWLDDEEDSVDAKRIESLNKKKADLQADIDEEEYGLDDLISAKEQEISDYEASDEYTEAESALEDARDELNKAKNHRDVKYADKEDDVEEAKEAVEAAQAAIDTVNDKIAYLADKVAIETQKVELTAEVAAQDKAITAAENARKAAIVAYVEKAGISVKDSKYSNVTDQNKIDAEAKYAEIRDAAIAAAPEAVKAATEAAFDAQIAAKAAAYDAKVAAIDAAEAAQAAAIEAAEAAQAAAIEAADKAFSDATANAGNVTTYSVTENKQNITGNLNTRNNDATGAAYNYNFTYGSFLANYLPTYWSEWNITAKLTITVGSTTSEFTRMCVPNIMMFNGEKANAKAELIALAEAEYVWADTSVEGNPYRLAWESAVKEVFDANPYATYAPIVVAPEASTDSAAGGAAPSAPAAGAGDSAC